MDLKKFWKETFGGFVLKNVLIAVGVIVAMSWISLICVDFYTHHGEAEVVPDLRGSTIEEAQVILSSKGLHVQVIDSVYVRGKKLGTIIEQNPSPNSNIKTNRPIYIKINSRFVRQVSLPELSDVSYRQADAMLQSIGISVGSVEYSPSEYKDLVIQVKFHGRAVLPGTRIPEGSAVVLVVGSGLGNAETQIPAIKGMGLNEATEAITAATFVVGAVEYDATPSGNEDEYIIYRQRPAAGSSLPAGSKINLYLSKDKGRMNETFEEDKKPEESNEQFF